MLTVEALAARDCEWRHHVIAYFEVLYRRSDFMDVPGELVAHDEVCAGWLMASVDMKLTERGWLLEVWYKWGKRCLNVPPAQCRLRHVSVEVNEEYLLVPCQP
jgi:hypothetical protein